MAITVKHSKVSTIPDDADTSLVRPSDWNADHTLTGTIDIANGGTGQTTANAAFNALVPSQTGNTGKYLTTNGTDTSWATNPLGTVTSVDLTASTGISVSGGPITTSGSITVTNTAPDQTVVLNSGTGISTSGTYPNFTVTNTAPDQTVSIASGTGISTSGTYPAFTVTNTGVTSAVAGTGISVSGSTGAVTVTNTAPDQTVVLTAGTGISTSGTYPNFTITNTSPSLGGDVVGPASATDNAVARFDTTTGKLIQNSTITLDDNGNLVNVNSVGFDTTPATVPTTVGTMSWDDGDGVPIVALKGGNVNLQVGTQELARVYNDSGTTLTKGQAVYISGAQGNRVAVRLARANVEATSFGTIGLVAETMTSGAEGFIIVSGALYKLNTTGLTAGATVYLSPTTAGAVTTTKPQAPDQLVVIGWVERVDNIVGSIYVKIDNGYELDELHDVQITSPQSGNLLIYDATTTPVGVWKNANLTDGTGITITEGAGSVTIANAGVTALSAGTGISVSGSTGSVTVTNTAPDQTVSLTGAGTTSISGTYPNFTITSNDQYVGTVTSVSALTLGTTGTDLSSTVANGTTTPVITLNVPTASATNRGALSSADWTTFNNKAAPFTYTSTYIPFGQGTTTPNQSANLTFDGTSLTAPVQRASNGIVTNSKTIGTSFTIPATDNAMSSGPVTLSAGVTVTVSSGSRWVVL
jgi:hypothetical protein